MDLYDLDRRNAEALERGQRNFETDPNCNDIKESEDDMKGVWEDIEEEEARDEYLGRKYNA